MTTTPVVFPFRVVQDVFYPPERQDDDSPAWTATWCSDQSGPFEVTFERREKAARDVGADDCAEWEVTTGRKEHALTYKNAHAAFQGTGDDRGALFDEMAVTGRQQPTYFVMVSDLATMAKRCHAACVGEDAQYTMGTADFIINIKYSRTVGITFRTTMDVEFEDPERFDKLDVRALERMAHLDMDVEADTTEREDTPAVPVRSFADASEVGGDVFARPLSEVGVVSELEPLHVLDTGQAERGPLGDAVFCVDVSPTAKYTALAEAIAAMTRREGRLLIAGDAPGTLAQAALARGIGVFGVDPRNTTTVQRGIHGRGEYEMVQGTVTKGAEGCEVRDDKDNLRALPNDISCYVVDTTTDTEDAAASTARNLSIGWSIKEHSPDAVVIVQLRSMPLLEGRYGILQLPGHSNQGCETYVVLQVGTRDYGMEGHCAWWAYCWALAEVQPDMEGTEWLDAHDRFRFWIARRHRQSVDVVRLFFEPWDDGAADPEREGSVYSGSGTLSTWYHFIITRAFAEASKYAQRGAAAVALSASNPVELLAGLEATLDDGPVQGVEAVFTVDYAEGLTGVTPGIFRRHPTLRRIVRARYDALAKLTVYDTATVPPDIGTIFSTPASGVLLRGISAMRNMDEGWGGPKISRYKRVLPYELMACLSSRALFRAVYMYAFACLHGLGKPVHAWELQHMLWTLTVHGTMNERFKYIAIRLRGAVKPMSTGRRAPPLGPGHDGFLASFERNLRVLGVADAYSSFDKEYDDARNRIFSRTRSRELRPDRERIDPPDIPPLPRASFVTRSPRVATRWRDERTGTKKGRDLTKFFS